MIRAIVIALFGLTLTPLGGCGGVVKPVIPRALESSYQLNASTSGDPDSLELTSQYHCPNYPNIMPDYDYELDGTGRYSACYNKSEKSKILIHGKTGKNDTICIFPAQIIDSKHVYAKPDTQTGGPWHQCVPISSTGVFADFPNIEYNGLFIVESDDESQMSRCLIGGNYYNCPPYSFGRFR